MSLKNQRLVLASASPRRKEILERLCSFSGLVFEVIPSSFAETLPKQDAEQYVSKTALEKGIEVLDSLKVIFILKKDQAAVVISADTIVVLDGIIIEKPTSHANALDILQSLSGRSHEVKTAVWILDGAKRFGFVETTNVTFAHVSQSVLEAYIETQEPIDKAGAYGYQGIASLFISKIDGCYWNVVGLPARALFSHLTEHGYL